MNELPIAAEISTRELPNVTNPVPFSSSGFSSCSVPMKIQQGQGNAAGAAERPFYRRDITTYALRHDFGRQRKPEPSKNKDLQEVVESVKGRFAGSSRLGAIILEGELPAPGRAGAKRREWWAQKLNNTKPRKRRRVVIADLEPVPEPETDLAQEDIPEIDTGPVLDIPEVVEQPKPVSLYTKKIELALSRPIITENTLATCSTDNAQSSGPILRVAKKRRSAGQTFKLAQGADVNISKRIRVASNSSDSDIDDRNVEPDLCDPESDDGGFRCPSPGEAEPISDLLEILSFGALAHLQHSKLCNAILHPIDHFEPYCLPSSVPQTSNEVS